MYPCWSAEMKGLKQTRTPIIVIIIIFFFLKSDDVSKASDPKIGGPKGKEKTIQLTYENISSN